MVFEGRQNLSVFEIIEVMKRNIPILIVNPNYSQTFSTRKKRVVSHCVPSPLDPLSHEWERAPLPTPGLRLPLARAQRGRGGLGGEGRKRVEIHE